MKLDVSVVILTGNHLCHNPRVLKEATALSEVGCRVEVLGAWFDSDLKARDADLRDQIAFRFTPVIDFTEHRVNQFGCRIASRLGKTAYKMLKLENDWQLSPGIPALGKAALETNADLFVAHSEAGMVVAAELLKRGSKVGLDMEDWFSEDLLPVALRSRPQKRLRLLEEMLLREGSYRACPSRAMAEALAAEYRCEQPTVIYNAFPWRDRQFLDGLIQDRRDRSLPSIHWYSQTLGFGRGLDDLVAAIPMLRYDCEIHLRGRPTRAFEAWLTSRVPHLLGQRIFVHELTSNAELLSRIAEHDIGFAGEQDYCRSRDLTVTNKILHYLVAGLAVVASNTSGQQEIALAAPDAVFPYSIGKPEELACQLNALLGAPERLANAKKAALDVAKEKFCWEKSRGILISAFEESLCI